MELIKTYAGYNINQDIRLSSSSGAIFSLLAEHILSKDGIIYGVKMSDDCYSAEFTRVTDVSQLMVLRGSKYLQAKVGNTYKQVRDDLMSGRFVLFSGTGCQVNGLKKYLGKEYETLVCVDVICHGAPSPALWRKYAKYQEKKNGGKLKSINFRCKDDSWIDFGMKEHILDNQNGKLNTLYIGKDDDTYMQMFLRDFCLRPSCYECMAKKFKMADLTVADFWGINDVAPEMNDGKGTSLILIRTEKGQKVFNTISSNLKLKEVTYDDGVRCNPAEYKSCRRPSERNTFFVDMCAMDYSQLEKKYAFPMTFKRRLKRKIKNTIKLALRVIGGGRDCKNNEEYGLLFVFLIDYQEKN